MIWLPVCLVLFWMGLGGAILSDINRGDMQQRYDQDYLEEGREIERGMIEEKFKKDVGETALIFLLFLFAWPFVLFLLKEEMNDKNAPNR